ncbi:MAG: hypothetical protein ABIH23_15490 [bacterium]
MPEVKRFDCFGSIYADMTEADNGDYVLYEDYAKERLLRKRAERALKLLAQSVAMGGNMRSIKPEAIVEYYTDKATKCDSCPAHMPESWNGCAYDSEPSECGKAQAEEASHE